MQSSPAQDGSVNYPSKLVVKTPFDVHRSTVILGVLRLQGLQRFAPQPLRSG